MKKILLLFWTHGDEISLKKSLNFIDKWTLNKVDIIDVNEEAIKEGKRFINYNINRISPWDINSDNYELRRTAEIINKSKEYELVIDIHGTNSKVDSFILLPKCTIKHLMVSALIDCKNIVIWQSNINEKQWPLVQFMNLGIEIENGALWDSKVERNLWKILENLIEEYNNNFTIQELIFRLENKNIYIVTHKLSSSVDTVINGDFEQVQIKNEVYHTILTNNPYDNIKCYLMKKIDINEALTYIWKDINMKTKVLN